MKERFAPARGEVAEEASRTCAAWLAEEREVERGPTMASELPAVVVLHARHKVEIVVFFFYRLCYLFVGLARIVLFELRECREICWLVPILFGTRFAHGFC